MTNKRIECLDKAKTIVAGDRDKQYGNPEDNFDLIARLWNTYLGMHSIDAKDVAMMMALLKVARVRTATSYSEDSFIDIAGYAACASEIEERKSPAVVMDCSSMQVAEVIVNEN